MTKPNFDKMIRAELKAYVLAHRDDDEAFHAFLSKPVIRSGPYPAPLDEEGVKIMEEAFRKKIQEIENSQPPSSGY